MRLIEEIRLLRKNLLNVKNLTVETPTAGGSVDSAYELVMYMALARNILTKIEKCKHNKFPHIKRKLENKVQNKEKLIKTKEMFNRIVHGAYIRKSEEDLHVINDRGEEYIVSLEVFMNVLDSLCLEDHEAVLVMCEILRGQAQRIQKIYEKDSQKDGIDDETMKIWNQIIHTSLDWLVWTYCSNGDLAQKVVINFFPEQEKKKLLPSLWVGGARWGKDYFAIELGSKWLQETDEVVEKRFVSIYNFLDMIEEYAEKILTD